MKGEREREREKVNKTGLQPVLRPVEQPLLGFKTVGERVCKSVQKTLAKQKKLKKVWKNKPGLLTK